MNIDKSFIDHFVKATEWGAYGASLLKGKNDKIAADQAAVNEMRKHLNMIKMKGTIVIGEGELDEAPMLHINEKLGNNVGDEFDIAVDPLAGTNFTAKNLPNALTVLAVTRKNKLFKAPDTYMEKIVVGPNLPKNIIDLDISTKENINRLAEAKKTQTNKLTAVLLERPRHEKIVKDLKALGVNINFISDGDVSGALSVGLADVNADIYLGIGGSPEGVLAAAALRCIGGRIYTKLVFDNNRQIERAKNMGISDPKKIYQTTDLASGDVMFSATGVTDGTLLKGVLIKNESATTHSVVMRSKTKTLRYVSANHDLSIKNIIA